MRKKFVRRVKIMIFYARIYSKTTTILQNKDHHCRWASANDLQAFGFSQSTTPSGFEWKNSWHASSTSSNDSNRRPFGKVLHWSEETVVRWSSVWTIGQMRQNFDTVQFIAVLSGSTRLCIVLLKQSVFSTKQNLGTFQPAHRRLNEVARGKLQRWWRHHSAQVQNAKDSFEVPPKRKSWSSFQIDFALRTDGGVWPFGTQRLASIVIDQIDPLLVWCHNSLPKTVTFKGLLSNWRQISTLLTACTSINSCGSCRGFLWTKSSCLRWLQTVFWSTPSSSANSRVCLMTGVMFHSLVIVSLVLITEIATWWYDHRTEQKNNTLPSHGIEPCTSCFPGRRINHCTRKECWSFVSFRLMFEGEHFEHNNGSTSKGACKSPSSKTVGSSGTWPLSSRSKSPSLKRLKPFLCSSRYHRTFTFNVANCFGSCFMHPNSFSNNDAAIREAENLWFRNQTSFKKSINFHNNHETRSKTQKILKNHYFNTAHELFPQPYIWYCQQHQVGTIKDNSWTWWIYCGRCRSTALSFK